MIEIMNLNFIFLFSSYIGKNLFFRAPAYFKTFTSGENYWKNAI